MATNFCSNCGEPVTGPGAKVCVNCGRPLYMAQTESTSNENDQYTAENQRWNYNKTQNNGEEADYYEVPKSQPANANLKSPFLAFALSFFWVGLGQLYNGKFAKGFLLNVCFAFGMILFIPGLIVWVFSLWDAYTEAEKMNRGEIPFANPSFWEVMVFLFFWAAIGIIIAIIVLFFALVIVGSSTALMV